MIKLLEILEEELIDEANSLSGGNIVGYINPFTDKHKRNKADIFFPDRKGKKIKTASLNENWIKPDLESEEDEIWNTKISKRIIELEFENGKLITLTDKIWSQLENTDSYEIKNIKDVEKLATKYKKDYKPLIKDIKNSVNIKAPIVILKPNGDIILWLAILG
jgi:hypothetical protein